MKRVLRTVSVFFTFIGIASFAFAQNASTYPVKPITLIVPFPPGGVTDLVARDLAKRLSEGLGQPVVVDNRAGAGGNIGTAALARAQPDGYTLGVMTVSAMSIGPHIHKSLSFVPAKDFTPITNIVNTPGAILAGNKTPYNTLQELIKAAKAQPGKINYASVGLGSLPHLIAEKLALDAGIAMTHIPYKGAAPAITDLLGGQTDYMFSTPQSVLGMLQGGKLRALAVSSSQRLKVLPQVPTVAEQGYKGFEAVDWKMVVAPANTPAPVLRRLNAAAEKVLNSASFMAQMAAEGSTPIGGNLEKIAAYLKAEQSEWGDLIREAGIKFD